MAWLIFFGNYNLYASIYTIDYYDLAVSSFMENSIGFKRVIDLPENIQSQVTYCIVLDSLKREL